MFKINDVSGEEIINSILACQENEDPIVRVIDTKGLFITPLPRRIPLVKETEWMESGRKSPTAWRLEVDDLLDGFVKTKKRKF